jgi:predicted TIM-barrel fold metal-dependent hydrolase
MIDRVAGSDFGQGCVVDAHHHLWNVAEQPYPWLSGAPPGSVEATLAERDGDYEAPAYRAEVERLCVVASVHVQADWDPRDPVGETRWLQAQHERHGLPSAIVGYARLEDPGARDVLLAHARCEAFRGIRQVLAWDVPDDLMDDRAWRQGLALLAPLGLSFELAVLPPQLAAAAQLARAFPATAFVLGHAGHPAETTDRAVWLDGVRRLADCPNVAVKLSGLTQPQRSVDAIREDVEELLAAFGCERAMFGSNLPVERLDGSVQVLVDALDGALAARSQQERDAVWGATAARFYRLAPA